MAWRTRQRNEQKGQALVETALMILIILLLMMGIIEFGFIFFAYVRVANATREGARTGSLWLVDRKTDGAYYDPILCDTVRNAVQGEFSSIPESGISLMTLDQGAVTCPDDETNLLPPEAGEPITVTVIYDYSLPIVSDLPIIGEIIDSPFPVSRTVVMRFQ